MMLTVVAELLNKMRVEAPPPAGAFVSVVEIAV